MADVHGWCAPGWEGVRDAFVRNFDEHGDVGAATAVHHDGRLVVDLWGGTYAAGHAPARLLDDEGLDGGARQPARRARRSSTSTRRSRRTGRSSPAEGKGAIPVRWLLTHQAGLPYPTEACTLEDVLDWDGVIDKLARSTPVWEPGTAHGYHAVTYGFLVGEVLRRITGSTSVGALLHDELAGPARPRRVDRPARGAASRGSSRSSAA